MITNPVKATQFGVDTGYYFINSFKYDRKTNSVEVIIGGYNTTANGTAMVTPLYNQTINAKWADLPAAIKTALTNLGVSIENVLITMPDYVGGSVS